MKIGGSTILHNSGIAYYDLTSSSGSSDGVRLSTLHNMKGLEFKIVILSDINNRTAPLTPRDYELWDQDKKEMHLKSEKSLLYVAVSRAMYKVALFGTGVKSDIIKI